ncbi:MAG: SDR family oxidoreductase [Xanthomonadales bacterium]|nr:SDR family oxidoreductase [Xanthomonadales bacterium]
MVDQPSNDLRRFVGRVAIITGGGSGIGEATTHRLATEGARVVVADVDAAAAARVATDIDSAGGAALGIEVDVAEEDAVAGMVATAVDTFGRIDILHNNAAAVGRRSVGGDDDLLRIDPVDWDRSMAVNLRSVVLCCKHTIPHLLDSGGAIVNTSSGSALTGFTSRFAYGASKAGVITFTQYVATTYGKQGVRANVVAPGLILTPASEGIDEVSRTIFEDHCLTPRLGRPEDVAAVVAFLASDDAAFITGETISVDGGTLAHTPTWAQFRDAGARG